MGIDKTTWLTNLDRDARAAGGAGLPDNIRARLHTLSYDDVGRWVDELSSQIPPTAGQVRWLESLGLTALTRVDAAKQIKDAKEKANKPADPAEVQRLVQEREEAAARHEEAMAMRALTEHEMKVRFWNLSPDELLPFVKQCADKYGDNAEKKILTSIPEPYQEKFLAVLRLVQPIEDHYPEEMDMELIMAGIEL